MDSGVWKDLLLSTGAAVVASRAGWIDWRSRKIPNRLTVPALLVGLAASTFLWGWPGAKAALEGAGICLGVLLPFVLMRGLGAGDWKLMGALGAFLGLRVIWVLLGTVLIVGLMSVVEIIRQRKIRQTLSNLWVLFVACATFHISSAGAITLDNPGLLKIPFGVAAALATGFYFVGLCAVRFLLMPR